MINVLSSRQPKSASVERATLERAVPLISPEGGWTPQPLVEFLSSNTDFIVVGAIGLHGAGRSTLLNSLAACSSTDGGSGSGSGSGSTAVPPPFATGRGVASSHQTESVECFLTSGHTRLLLIDTPPVLSSSVLMRARASGSAGSSETVERELERTSRRMAAFMLSVSQELSTPATRTNATALLDLSHATVPIRPQVCDVLLVVQDRTLEPDLLHLVKTAHLLQATASPSWASTSQHPPLSGDAAKLGFVTCRVTPGPGVLTREGLVEQQQALSEFLEVSVGDSDYEGEGEGEGAVVEDQTGRTIGRVEGNRGEIAGVNRGEITSVPRHAVFVHTIPAAEHVPAAPVVKGRGSSNARMRPNRGVGGSFELAAAVSQLRRRVLQKGAERRRRGRTSGPAQSEIGWAEMAERAWSELGSGEASREWDVAIDRDSKPLFGWELKY